MSPKPERPATDEEDALRSEIRRIVLSRETVPRTPRWSRAFRRTLLRLARTIREAKPSGPPQDEIPTLPSEECNDDQC